MSVMLEEGRLKFQFEEASVPWKYDDSSFYRNQFQSFAGGAKGVDFLCHTKGALWLIEVKDYRAHERQKSQDLSEEVAEKVRDTLAGLAALRVNGNDPDERKRATAALKEKRLRVVLHLELPKMKRVSRLYPDIKLHCDFQEHLKAVVRAVDSHPKVVCMAEGLQYCPWSVTDWRHDAMHSIPVHPRFQKFGGRPTVPETSQRSRRGGGNGTGKSTLLQFFERLSFVSHPDKFREYIIRHGGGNAQCFMGGAVTPVITASVILMTEAGNYEYSLKLRYVLDDDQLVAEESRWRFLPTTAPIDKERLEKMLQQLGSCYGGFWESCPMFHFCRSAAEADVNKRWDIGDSARLRLDGANLAPVLLSLRKHNPLRYRYIVRQIQRVFPDFGNFVLKDECGRVLLQWKHRFSDQIIGPYLTSDGTLRFFFLVTLLNLPEDRWPPLLMIDEPETGLHPHAVELIAAMMRRVSYKRQVLVATQSPALVDAVEPNDVIVTTVSRGAAQFARVPPAVWRRWQEGGCTLSGPVGWGCGSELR